MAGSWSLVTVKDPNVRVMKLLRGEVQMLQNDLSPELIGYLERSRQVQVIRGPGVNFSYLGFNMEDPDTGRPQVRQALAHAIDRPAILRHLFQGGGRTADGLFPPDTGPPTRTSKVSATTLNVPRSCWVPPASALGTPCA